MPSSKSTSNSYITAGPFQSHPSNSSISASSNISDLVMSDKSIIPYDPATTHLSDLAPNILLGPVLGPSGNGSPISPTPRPEPGMTDLGVVKVPEGNTCQSFPESIGLYNIHTDPNIKFHIRSILQDQPVQSVEDLIQALEEEDEGPKPSPVWTPYKNSEGEFQEYTQRLIEAEEESIAWCTWPSTRPHSKAAATSHPPDANPATWEEEDTKAPVETRTTLSPPLRPAAPQPFHVVSSATIKPANHTINFSPHTSQVNDAHQDLDAHRHIWEILCNRDTESLNSVQENLDSIWHLMMADAQTIKEDCEQLRNDTKAAQTQVAQAHQNIWQQLQSLMTFTGHIRCITEAIEPSFPTPTIALGTIINQVAFLLQDTACDRSHLATFNLYWLIIPFLSGLLQVLRKLDSTHGLPAVNPPRVDVKQFRELIQALQFCLSDEEYAQAIGQPLEFEDSGSNPPMTPVMAHQL
ncbi:hypothetical protein BS47DRAFT_1399413 [Hydnum rufescens UP504]|uniref:Uncharacterized protein n=1 Tax=Hydnum rufescens UP504 TaxID=1448309 RepID=A0A9P6AIU1_9AGAM|nr:hypothetical protein BS47DRAFT_1399413 [Hydnum rufescens UP504]